MDDPNIKEKFYEIPHPFDIKSSGNTFIFDYRMNKLGLDFDGVMQVHELVKEEGTKNKFIGKRVILTFRAH